jgi:hypothetical protein
MNAAIEEVATKGTKSTNSGNHFVLLVPFGGIISFFPEIA